VIIVIAVAASMKNQGQEKGQIEVSNLSEKYKDVSAVLRSAVIDEKTLKEEKKANKKREKKGENSEESSKPRVFVTDFDGDIKASATDELREVVSAVLSLATAEDEVVVRLESQGGMVHSYGLAAVSIKSQQAVAT